MFNTILVPGLAVPTGTTIYILLVEKMQIFDQLFKTFYSIKNGTFWAILLIQ